MRFLSSAFCLSSLLASVLASPYNESLADYNLNTNQNAQSPLQYDTNHLPTNYTPSPDNWRAIPFYTVLMDKFADGDPSNNDYFNTTFEWDWRETQLRYGGDLKGLELKLDYLAGMGIKGIFSSGTPFLNMPWQADSTLIRLIASLTKLSVSFQRLFCSRLYGTRSSLGNHCYMERSHQCSSRSWHVFYDGFHCRDHG
jgi:hypothetical protein